MMLYITLAIVVLMSLWVTYLAWKGMADDLGDIPDYGDRWIRRK